MDLLSLPSTRPAAVAVAAYSLSRFPTGAQLASTKLALSFSISTKNPVFARHGINSRASISTRASHPSHPAENAAPSSSLATISPPAGWIVVMEKPPGGRSSKAEVIDYYVETLSRVLGNEEDAQMCIYDASWQNQFGFCCDINEESSHELARVPGVLYVRPDIDEGYGKKDYSYSDPFPVNHLKPDGCSSSFSLFSKNNEYWLVRMDKPGVEVVSKAQMVDYYAQALTKVMGNEKDAQVCIYHISWEKDFGFCCQIDYECARELADVPGVLSVRPDPNHESETKNYKGNDPNLSEAEAKQVPNIRTKRLFVTGLSFYTSEKTLRAAFEGFGQLVEVKIIMDKISKRSKGYAFIEYTTEEAASAALKDMNGKIINGWMIVVDVAKTNPPRYNRGQPRPSLSSTSSSY
ncbi:organelle RRM domain-containing protein 1, chloroplastic-like [Zingiber officinale]|uniref:organelle RRM domain-containing protein 1, chloroplastic-like n=1 Tax=Zingiber officinale TaxID=94328 RepID=UPI001C4CB7DB|nr:organelle RRM domain-containing protein 1, chloroplastic-like [Zingiber officinale]